MNPKIDRRAVDFDIKVSWLAIARMYNAKALPQGLTSNVGFVLLHIDSAHGTPATKIAPLMGMEPRSLSRMLARLQSNGLIFRKSDKKDKRMVRIFLTEEGIRLKNVAREVVIDFNKKIYQEISPEKLSTFFEVIDSLKAIVAQENRLLREGEDGSDEEDLL